MARNKHQKEENRKNKLTSNLCLISMLGILFVVSVVLVGCEFKSDAQKSNERYLRIQQQMITPCIESHRCIFDCLSGYTLIIKNGSEEWTQTARYENEFIEKYNYTVKCMEVQIIDLAK